MFRTRLVAALLGAILSLATLTPAHALVSIAPELEAQLREQGAYGQVMAQLQRARETGMFEAEDPYRAEGRAKDLGKVRNWRAIVILVDFSDFPASGNYNQPEFDNMIFGENSYPTGSMRDFYLENSHDDFQFTGDVVGWLRMPQPLSYYANNDGVAGTGDDYGFGGYPNNARKLYEDAVAAADPTVNFAQYSNGFSGVRGVFIVHSGPGAETTGNPNYIWSHQSGSTVTTNDGVQTQTYIFMPELQGAGMSTVGVFCHEFGHVLGLPDLYDTDGTSRGIGRWGLMGGGSWNGGGTRPAHYTGWAKERLGMTTVVEPVVNQNGYLVTPVIDTNMVVKVQTPNHAPDEYLMIENRRSAGFDDALPSSGLLIYHIDDSVNSNSAETCEGAAPVHPIVRVIQSDGLCQLEDDVSSGNASDPFPGSLNVTEIGATTVPSTRTYAGAKSGVKLTNITQVGLDIQFDLVLDETILALVTSDVPTLAEALSVAGNGDEIRLPAGHVAPGNLVVNGGVLISGGWDPTSFTTQDPQQPSVIQGGTSARSVLEAKPGHMPLRLDNLVVRDGKGVRIFTPDPEWRGGAIEARGVTGVITRTRFESNKSGSNDEVPAYGGALAFEDSDFTLEDCTFALNQAKEGGAIWTSGGNLTLRRTNFEGSTLVMPLVANDQRGGALLALNTDVVMEDCNFEGYAGASHGGAIFAEGGAPISITRTTFDSNSSRQEGGALWLQVGQMTFRDVDLLGNSTVSGGGGVAATGGVLDWGGGSMRNNSGALLGAGAKLTSPASGSRISGVAMVDNQASVVGGGIMLSGGALDLDHVTVAGNLGGGLLLTGATVRVFDSIIASNTGAGITFASATVTGIDHNVWFANSGGDVTGATKGPADIDADPVFAGAGDYHLGLASPAIDTGSDSAPVDFDGSRNDRGAFAGEFDAGGRPQGLNSTSLSEPVPGDFRVSWQTALSAPGATAAAQVAIFGQNVASKAMPLGLPWLHSEPAASGEWTDVGVGASALVHYQLQPVDSAGRAGSYSGDLTNEAVPAPLPAALWRVAEAAPNPFNPTTRVDFELPGAARVRADIYDLAGRHIATLVDGRLQAGLHSLVWKGLDGAGHRVASGVYLLRVSSEYGEATRRLALVK